MSAPAVAVDQNGDISVAWKHLARGRPSLSWAPPRVLGHRDVALVSTPDTSQDHPAATGGPGNNVWIVWEETRNGVRTIRWGGSERALNDPADGEAAFPTIAFSRRGGLIVVWEARQGDRFRVFCRTVHLHG